jgi:8-oxo-dGTP pyrophosphatase MutT (NUDIX family)
MLGMRQAARDMAPEKLSLLGRLFSQWINEEAAEPEHQTNDALPHAAGSLMMTKDGRALFVRRAAGKDHAGAWSIPAGMSEGDEAPWQTAMRETHEEVGDCGMEPRGMKLLDHTLQPNVGFTTYGYQVDNEFQPTLDAEHDSYMWAPLDQAPHPLHPGLEQTIHDFAMDPLTDKGQQVFYASKNKGKIEGVDNSLTARDRIVPNPSDRFTLTADDKILDRQTGVSYNANDAMRIMFAPDKFINKDATAGKVDVPSPTPIVNKVDTAAWRMPKIEARGEDQVAPNWQTPRFPQQDAGTSEGARKAAIARKQAGAFKQQSAEFERNDLARQAGYHEAKRNPGLVARRQAAEYRKQNPQQDAGTSEGARKAAQTRKSGGGVHPAIQQRHTAELREAHELGRRHGQQGLAASSPHANVMPHERSMSPGHLARKKQLHNAYLEGHERGLQTHSAFIGAGRRK